MNGFVKNLTNTFMYALQRQWAPGQEVSLDELYEQYGVKHGLEAGPEFIVWLIGLKLPDRSKWQVVCEGQIIDTINQANMLPKPKVTKKRKARFDAIITKVSDMPIDLDENITFPGEKVLENKESDGDANVDVKVSDEAQDRKIDAITGRPLDRKQMVLKRRVAKGPGVKIELTPEDILNLKSVEIREKLKNVKDARILRVALKAAENRRNTATLCKLLRERLSQLKYSQP